MMESFEKKEKLCLALEKALGDKSVAPINLPFWFLETITDNFSEEKQIGSGGFGSVYQGALRNGIVAVKKLHNKIEVEEKDFYREVACLIDVEHRNIVRFLGYCYETHHQVCRHEGRHVLVDQKNMLFCFEFLRKGSLAKCVTGPSSGLQWGLHYQIIKGICEGVRYLHQEKRITHMDLKPDNILLDDSMVPKIADFGLSRRFSEKQSKIITENIVGTRRYMAPEFLKTGTITFKVDIYSLGVIIIEIMMGCKERPNVVDKVLESWMNTFGTSMSSPLLKQVKLCAEIGIDCMHDDPSRRPGILEIIQKLKETDISVPQMGSSSRFYPDKQAYKPMQNTAPVTQKDDRWRPPQGSPAAASLLPAVAASTWAPQPPATITQGWQQQHGPRPLASMTQGQWSSSSRPPSLGGFQMQPATTITQGWQHGPPPQGSSVTQGQWNTSTTPQPGGFQIIDTFQFPGGVVTSETVVNNGWFPGNGSTPPDAGNRFARR